MNGFVSWVPFQFVHHLCIGRQLISVYCLYVATLLNVFTSCEGFLVEIVGSSMYRIIPSVNKDAWISSFSNSFTVLSFQLCLQLCLWVHIEHVEGADILVLFLILVEILSVFPKGDVDCVLPAYWLYYVEICSPCSIFFQDSYHEGILHYVKGPFWVFLNLIR